MSRLIIISLFCLSLVACQHDTSKHSSHFGSPDYSDINKENITRDVWQKPGKVLEALGDISNKTIADIGAGTGYFTFRMALNAKKVIAVDINPEMIYLIEAFKVNLPKDLNSKIETRLATPTNSNLKKEEVDIVVIINTASYIEDKNAYFKKIMDILPIGGSLMIVDYKQSKLPISLEQGDYSVSGKELAALLEKVGFQSTSIDDSSLEYQYIVFAQK